MLGKLAVRNTKRSLKDYLIYLITITISFSLILAYNLVASSNEVVELSSGMETFKTILTFAAFAGSPGCDRRNSVIPRKRE